MFGYIFSVVDDACLRLQKFNPDKSGGQVFKRDLQVQKSPCRSGKTLRNNFIPNILKNWWFSLFFNTPL